MKNLRFLMYIVLFALCLSKFAYAQHIKVIDSYNLNEKYKKLSKFDTIKIISLAGNCIGCIEKKITIYYSGNNAHIVLEDSFRTVLHAKKNVYAKNNRRLLSLIQKSLLTNELTKNDCRLIHDLIKEDTLEFIQKPRDVHRYIFNNEFFYIANKINYLEKIVKISKGENSLIIFKIGNQQPIEYFSNIDIEQYFFDDIIPYLEK